MKSSSSTNDCYRKLQKHLNNQAIGFPAAPNGADIKLLQRFFTEEEAILATYLSFRPVNESIIIEKSKNLFNKAKVILLLQSMVMKGAIGHKVKSDENYWFVVPLVIGIWEYQDGNLSSDLISDVNEYAKTLAYRREFINVNPSQLRTIPIKESIKVDQLVATYDDIEKIVLNAPGPIVVIKCVCRERKKIEGGKCEKTDRENTCISFGDHAATRVLRKSGKEISKERALEIFKQNEEDGLVFQPSNSQNPDFVCSCCGCCCGMLNMQKHLPRPVEQWATNYYSEIDLETCIGCRKCIKSCQVNALDFDKILKKVNVNRDRCIGCGCCVRVCPTASIEIKQKKNIKTPPLNSEELNELIFKNRKNPLIQWIKALKILFQLKFCK